MIYRSMMFVAVLALAGLAHAQDESAGTDLRPIWEKGQESRYRVVTERLTAAQVLGVSKPRASKFKVLAEITWQVADADANGGGTCKMTVDKMEMLITDYTGKQVKIASHGSVPEKLQSAQDLIQAMLDKQLTVEVANDGTVTSVSGWKAIKNAAGDAGDKMKESDFIETATELALVVGGAADVSDGSSWNRRFDWTHEMGDLAIDTTYRFEGVEAIADVPVAMINSESKIDIEVDRSKLKSPDVQVRVTAGQETAQIMYDLSRGEVVGRNVDRTLGLEMKLTVQGRQFTQVIKQRMVSSALRIAEK